MDLLKLLLVHQFTNYGKYTTQIYINISLALGLRFVPLNDLHFPNYIQLLYQDTLN